MNKLSLTVLFLSLSLVFAFAGTGAKEAMMIKSPGNFDVAEYLSQHQAKSDWLMAEAAPLTPDAVLSVQVSEADINAIDKNTCDTCGDMTSARQRMRVGLVKPVNVSFSSLKPKVLANGDHVRTLSVEADGAVAMRVHITHFNLPENAALYIYNTEGTAFGPYTDLGPNKNGEFWTNTVFGSLAYLQLHYNGDSAFDCHVAGVGCLGSKFLIPFMQKTLSPDLDRAATHCSFNPDCIEDASCYSTSTYPAINTHKYAVGCMQWISGSWIYMCTGGLLNNTSSDYTPYFLTANHCISKSKDATNLECYFQFWTTSCQGACYDPIVCPRTLGATFITGSKKESDFTLLRLNQTPPSGSTFLGWNTTAIAYNDGYALYRLSHPMGAPQAFSKHEVDSDFGECRSWPLGKWIYSYDLIGSTDGGSSGSPVCNSSGQVVGQLSGGCGFNVTDVCDAESNRTVDGAFANYYSLVSSWLDPD